jgi:hypothetical protein
MTSDNVTFKSHFYPSNLSLFIDKVIKSISVNVEKSLQNCTEKSMGGIAFYTVAAKAHHHVTYSSHFYGRSYNNEDVNILAAKYISYKH